jgi:hypothetical protein
MEHQAIATARELVAQAFSLLIISCCTVLSPTIVLGRSLVGYGMEIRSSRIASLFVRGLGITR